MAYQRTARVAGADRQRIEVLEKALEKHAEADTVTALAGRVDNIEADVKQVAAALTKVAVLETKLDGLDRLMTRDMDEIKHTLRTIESRSFDPAPSGRSRRPIPT